ncbi:hypothetical protein QQF64_005470 [Cirrhinus molitorella]|uniref:Secreted protein n=1 Tax=Cirrhinus molitorella TaxID=172907 RepID=A0ABR3MCE0_9TELE
MLPCYLPLSVSPSLAALSLALTLISVGQSAQECLCSSCLFATTPPCPFTTAIAAVRTRPPFSALSSGANINQPQMFMLGERERARERMRDRGQQKQSHSIKLPPSSSSVFVFVRTSQVDEQSPEPQGIL